MTTEKFNNMQWETGMSVAYKFKNGVAPYDKNIVNYPKETKELLKLCKKACERIAKEVA